MSAIPWNRLQRAATSVSARAYSPYSRFTVGAALLTESGRIFAGCNVENASYGLTICAERNAIFQMAAAGERRIVAIAIYTPTAAPAAPCGACRQVIREFGSAAQIRSFCDGEMVAVWTLPQLLVDSFGPEDLGFTPAVEVSSGREAAKPLLVVDIDNVVADSDPVMRRLIADVTQGRVQLSQDDVHEFDYRNCHATNGAKLTDTEWNVVHEERFSSHDELVAIPPIEGAVEAIKRLREVYSVHFVTSRLPVARAATAMWLSQHEFVPKQIPKGKSPPGLHFLSSREKHLVFDHIAAAIDDDASQVKNFDQAGCELSIAFAKPWNKSLEGDSRIERIGDWPTLAERLLDYSRLE